MRALVTGASGFVGWNLVMALHGQGHDVTAIGLTETDAETGNKNRLQQAGIAFEPVAVDRPPEHWPLRGPFDTVFHLAAAQHRVAGGDSHFQCVNVDGTANALHFAVSSGARRFVHASTVGVWGELAGEIDEATPACPDSIYGRTKLESEARVRDRSGEIETVIARLPETYGPGDRPLLKLFRSVKQGKPVVIGNGRNRHHPMFVDDVVAALNVLAQHPEAIGETFVLAGPAPVTTGQMVNDIQKAVAQNGHDCRHLPLWPFLLAAPLVEMACRPLGVEPPLHRRRLGFFTKDQVLRTGKIERLLDYRPATGFTEGAVRTARWYRDEGLL